MCDVGMRGVGEKGGVTCRMQANRAASPDGHMVPVTTQVLKMTDT